VNVHARRRFHIALAVSIALHVLFFAIPMGKPIDQTVLGGASQAPFNVTIVEPERPPAEPEPQAQPAAPPPAARPPPPPILAQRKPTPSARTPLEPPPVKRVEPPPPITAPAEPKEAPPIDMAAMIEARRAQRRAAESALRTNREPTPDELAEATIARNLQARPGQGVGGVFQILTKGTRRAEFAFNGWRPNSDRQWREVIEVDAGLGGDIDRAIVRRMIELIRSHYDGDFRWESHRLGRVVILSARPEDTSGLEDFLIREFFGTPTMGPGK
jgi:outer membrane biosynthesis protein TonB